VALWAKILKSVSSPRLVILDFRFWILDFGFWILDFGFWIEDLSQLSIVNSFCLSSIKHLAFSPALAGFRFKQGYISFTSLAV
jgi:hypothetical protein